MRESERERERERERDLLYSTVARELIHALCLSLTHTHIHASDDNGGSRGSSREHSYVSHDSFICVP